jgi:hypothetical protein
MIIAAKRLIQSSRKTRKGLKTNALALGSDSVNSVGLHRQAYGTRLEQTMLKSIGYQTSCIAELEFIEHVLAVIIYCALAQ